MHRQQLLEIRNSLQDRMDLLAKRMGESDTHGLLRLQAEVQAYWDSLDPIFDWTPQEKAANSWSFLRRKVLPRRQAVMDLAREVAKLNKENLDRERQRIGQSQKVLHSFLLKMMGFALTLGTIVALITIVRVATLERRHDEQTHRIEEAEKNLRRLSRRLVQAQEVERKSLSRELHDEVGQMLTALGIELGNLQSSIRALDQGALSSRVDDAKRLNTDAMRVIRDLAMGLRPSMLDDLGLAPALEWQGREFSRHTGVPAEVMVDGSLDELSETHLTCIYRVVQEALTNCAKHAKAKNVSVSVHRRGEQVEAVIQDDGIGFEANSRAGGLGLLGIEERVQELEGKLRILSQPGRGTALHVEIPIRQTEATWAKSAS
jgi:signal transduction histidine kinase